jgi:hypothetical protein
MGMSYLLEMGPRIGIALWLSHQTLLLHLQPLSLVLLHGPHILSP